MKLIRPQAEGIVQVLKEVLINNRYADKALELFLRKTSICARRTVHLLPKQAMTLFATSGCYKPSARVKAYGNYWEHGQLSTITTLTTGKNFLE
jgi:hypothetical protein